MNTTILTWLWRQEVSRFDYETRHVNVLFDAVKRNTTLDVEFACVTDMPDGLDDYIKVIDMPDEFVHIEVKKWSERAHGMPQCFRRISMFAPAAWKTFGDRFLCMDLDCCVFGNIDHIVGTGEEFKMMRGSNKNKRPYNGSLILMTAGCRPHVYTRFNQENAEKACNKFIGSDQAWISYVLGWGEPTFDVKNDHVEFISDGNLRKYMGRGSARAEDVVMAFFPGNPKFFMDGTFHGASEEAIEVMNRMAGAPLWPVAKADPPKRKQRRFIRRGP